ncbi:hypothetical protein ACVWZR_003441 [Bradyrhizobium sp. i1.3.1]
MSTEQTPAFARPRQFERGSRHPANLAGGVLLGVETAALAVRQRFDAARFAEIDAAGELADDDEVDILQHRGLERRGVRQRRIGDDGPEIRIKVVLAAQRQQASRLARCRRDLSGFRTTRRAPEYRVGLLHRLDGVVRQHLARREIGDETVLRFAQRHGNAAPRRKPFENAVRLVGHFRTDAFTADHGDLDHVRERVHANCPA